VERGINKLKFSADAENEIHDLTTFSDLGQAVVSPIATFPAAVALGVVQTLAEVVRKGHSDPAALSQNSDGIVRAQMFEEGAVYMVAPPFDDFAADRYLMDFYDVEERDLCSRMHMHTGMRFVRMMTGPSTCIRVSALSPIKVSECCPAPDMGLVCFQDWFQVQPDSSSTVVRHNLVVPECAWVDMQIPRGTSHQFNAIGPNAVIDTVHPEESVEIFREQASRVNMMAQTVFLQEDQGASVECINFPKGLTR
jgi:hypothetical protein